MTLGSRAFLLRVNARRYFKERVAARQFGRCVSTLDALSPAANSSNHGVWSLHCTRVAFGLSHWLEAMRVTKHEAAVHRTAWGEPNAPSTIACLCRKGRDTSEDITDVIFMRRRRLRNGPVGLVKRSLARAVSHMHALGQGQAQTCKQHVSGTSTSTRSSVACCLVIG